MTTPVEQRRTEWLAFWHKFLELLSRGEDGPDALNGLWCGVAGGEASVAFLDEDGPDILQNKREGRPLFSGLNLRDYLQEDEPLNMPDEQIAQRILQSRGISEVTINEIAQLDDEVIRLLDRDHNEDQRSSNEIEDDDDEFEEATFGEENDE